MQAHVVTPKRVSRSVGRHVVLVVVALALALVSGGTNLAALQTGPDRAKKPAITVRAIRPEDTTVKVGEPIRVAFDIETPATWHFYPAAKKPLLGKQTVFEFDGAEVAGPIQEPRPKYYRAGVIETDYHEGKVTMTVPIRLKPGTAAGPFELNGRIVYQICDLNVCLNNVTPFRFTVTVVEPH
jgi:hypothetical protein